MIENSAKYGDRSVYDGDGLASGTTARMRPEQRINIAVWFLLQMII
jgi:hypothetical protein